MSNFNLNGYLKERKLLIDRALERYLKECKPHPKTLLEAMHYGLFSGGKRIRPWQSGMVTARDCPLCDATSWVGCGDEFKTLGS